MRVSKSFHESLRAYCVAEMIDAYEKSEDKDSSLREQIYWTKRVEIWRLLSDEEGKFISSFREEMPTVKMRTV